MAQAMESIVMGAGMGGAFHAIPSGVSDVLARRRGLPLAGSPQDQLLRALASPDRTAEIAEQGTEVPGNSPAIEPAGAPLHPADVLADLPPAAKEDAVHAAMADIISGRPTQAAEMLQIAADHDPRIAESLGEQREQSPDTTASSTRRPEPTAPDPLDLAISGHLSAERAREIGEDLKRQQTAVEDQIFGNRADEWRKLHRRSDRAWDNARDAEAKALDQQISQLEQDVGLTEEDENWLNGQGWSEHSVPEHWTDLAGNLQDIENGRDDAIAVSAAAVRDIPKTRDWSKMNSKERETVLTLLSAMNAETREGRDPKAFLRDVFRERIRRYGGGHDAQEIVEAQMRELSELLSGPIERSAEVRPAPASANAVQRSSPAVVAADPRWRQFTDASPDYNEPEVLAESEQAARVPEPASVNPQKSLSALEKAAADAEEVWRKLEPTLTEKERALVRDVMDQLNLDAEARSKIITDGAACLAGAIG
jgi:hypothetical protein